MSQNILVLVQHLCNHKYIYILYRRVNIQIIMRIYIDRSLVKNSYQERKKYKLVIIWLVDHSTSFMWGLPELSYIKSFQNMKMWFITNITKYLWGIKFNPNNLNRYFLLSWYFFLSIFFYLSIFLSWHYGSKSNCSYGWV